MSKREETPVPGSGGEAEEWKLPPLPRRAEPGSEAATPRAELPPESPQPPPLPPPWLRPEPIDASDDAAAAATGEAASAEAEAPTPTDTAPTEAPAAAEPPAPAAPAPAVSTPAEPPARVFGDTMATGVLLTLAGGSAAAGGILSLQQTDLFGFTVKAIICGGVAAVLLAGAVALRLVRGSDQLRGLLAVLAIAFAAAALAFADDPSSPTDHDNLVKFSLDAGLVAVVGWFAAIVVPSAVTGLIAAVALPSAAGAAVWISLSGPTHVQVYVTALGVGLALALLLPRLRILRPHHAGLGWTLAGAAVAVALPAAQLITRGDAVALAAGATASAALLLLAQRHRNLVAALGALVGLATLEAVLVTTYVSGSSGGSGPSSARLLTVAIAGAVLALLVAAGVLLGARRSADLPRWPLPVSPAELFLVAALALAIVALFTGPGDVPFNPPQLSSGSTATAPLAVSGG